MRVRTRTWPRGNRGDRASRANGGTRRRRHWHEFQRVVEDVGIRRADSPGALGLRRRHGPVGGAADRWREREGSSRTRRNGVLKDIRRLRRQRRRRRTPCSDQVPRDPGRHVPRPEGAIIAIIGRPTAARRAPGVVVQGRLPDDVRPCLPSGEVRVLAPTELERVLGEPGVGVVELRVDFAPGLGDPLQLGEDCNRCAGVVHRRWCRWCCRCHRPCCRHRLKADLLVWVHFEDNFQKKRAVYTYLGMLGGT